MNCPHCGRPTDPGATFCGNCGQPLTVAAVTPPTAGLAVPPSATVVPPAFGAAQAAPASPGPQTVPSPAGLDAAFAAPVGGSQPPVGGFSAQPIVAAAPLPPGASSSLPPYAVQATPTHPGEVRAIVGLILGVVALPGAIIPFLGLALGIAAIVIGSLSFRRKRVLAILGLIFGSIGIILSIIVFIYNVQRLNGTTHLSATTQTIDTPCYTATLSKDLHLTNSSGSCTISAIDGATPATSSIGYTVSSSSSPSLNEDNFAQQVAQGAQSIVDAANQGSEVFSIVKQQSDAVAGKTAYRIDTKSNKGRTAEIELVLDNAPNGNNLFVLINVKVGAGASIAPLADHLTWK